MSNQASLGEISSEEQEANKESEKSERTILGEIPREWNSDIVENLFNLRNGSAREDRSSSRNTSETEGEYDVYGANGKIAKYGDSNLDKGLVVGRVGSVGSVYEIDQPAWVSDNAIKAKLDSENNLRFLYYVMKRGRLDSLANQTAHPLLNQGIVGSVRLPIPEEDEQRRIASVLYNVDQAISKTEEIIEQTQRVKKGLMQDLFTEGYFEHEELVSKRVGAKNYKMPKNWGLEPLGNIAKVTSSTRIMKDEYKETGIPFYRSAEVVDIFEGNEINPNCISEEKYKEMKNKYDVPSEGDILVTAVGTLGIPYLVEEDDKFYFKDDNLEWIKSPEVSSRFLYYFLRTEIFRSQIEQRTAGSSQKNLTIGSLKKMQIVMPSEDEQERIVEVLESIQEEINLEMNKKARLQRLKKGLMQDLLTGEVRTDEAVEVLDEVKA